jgi:hypothetical protein
MRSLWKTCAWNCGDVCVAGVAIRMEGWLGPLLPGGEKGHIKVFADSEMI